MKALEAIHNRRSFGRLTEPAPTDVELRVMFEAAACAPDHKELRPWRFIVLRDDRKRALGTVLARALELRQPESTPGELDRELHKLDRAPVVIAIAAKRIETKLPFEELLCAAAAATQNLLLAATELGFGSMWRTGPAVYDPMVKAALGFDEQDALLGFIYVGTPAGERPPRDLDIDSVVTW